MDQIRKRIKFFVPIFLITFLPYGLFLIINLVQLIPQFQQIPHSLFFILAILWWVLIWLPLVLNIIALILIALHKRISYSVKFRYGLIYIGFFICATVTTLLLNVFIYPGQPQPMPYSICTKNPESEGCYACKNRVLGNNETICETCDLNSDANYVDLLSPREGYFIKSEEWESTRNCMNSISEHKQINE